LGATRVATSGCPRAHTSAARRPCDDESPAHAGLSKMRRRGLEPPPGYPGPGPQPCHPGVRYLLCVHIVQNERKSGRNGRNGRSGCCHGCCHTRSRRSDRVGPPSLRDLAALSRNPRRLGCWSEWPPPSKQTRSPLAQSEHEAGDCPAPSRALPRRLSVLVLRTASVTRSRSPIIAA
jgi:hypothetical protein